jgi:hypothetical protein
MVNRTYSFDLKRDGVAGEETMDAAGGRCFILEAWFWIPWSPSK